MGDRTLTAGRGRPALPAGERIADLQSPGEGGAGLMLGWYLSPFSFALDPCLDDFSE